MPFFHVNGAILSKGATGDPCTLCAQAKVSSGRFVRIPRRQGKSFWETGLINISFSLHKQKHNNAGRVALISQFVPACFPIWALVPMGARASLLALTGL